MQQTAWYPYAPDQAFGRQAARDEELVDEILARLDGGLRPVPRPGNKAPCGRAQTAPWTPESRHLAWLADEATDGPVTTASALDAAPLARGRPT